MAQVYEYNLRRAREIIKQILYVTIASVSDDGQPWNSPVYSSYDKELNFYWVSDKDSQHSRNIRANSKIFLVIYDSTMPESTGEGVYVLAHAQELSNLVEINSALRCLQDRGNKHGSDQDSQIFTGDGTRRVYKAIPEKIWINDDESDSMGSFVRDIRVEILINEIIE